MQMLIFTCIGANCFPFLVFLSCTTVHFRLSRSRSLSHKMPSGSFRRKNMLKQDHLHVMLGRRARVCTNVCTKSRMENNNLNLFYYENIPRRILSTKCRSLVPSYVHITFSLCIVIFRYWISDFLSYKSYFTMSQWVQRALFDQLLFEKWSSLWIQLSTKVS